MPTRSLRACEPSDRSVARGRSALWVRRPAAHAGSVGRRSRWLLIGSIAALLVATLALVVARAGDDGPATTSTTSSVPTTGTTQPSRTTDEREPPSTPPPTATSEVPPPPEPPATHPPGTPPTTVPPEVAVATVVRQGPAGQKVVALTFDAGSDLGHTAAILDALARNGIRASFGLTGTWAEAHPATVARIAREGHQLINHTWSHPSFTGYSTGTGPLPTAERRSQITRAETAIVEAAGVAAKPWFRPPYGDLDQSVLVDVGALGYRYVAMWTVDSLGWKGLPPAEIAQRCLDRAEPGAIYLFHVGSASADHAALQAIVDGLRARGYRFATLAELVGA